MFAATIYKGDANLVKELEESAQNHKMTPAERFEQRVSFVFGQVSHDSNFTKDQVRKILRESEGI